jgi:hypothetical protein
MANENEEGIVASGPRENESSIEEIALFLGEGSPNSG